MKLTSVTTAPDGVAAAVVKGVLEGAGIPAMLRAYQSAGWLFPGTPGSLGATEVLVPADRLDEAREILAAYAEGGPQAHIGRAPVEDGTSIRADDEAPT